MTAVVPSLLCIPDATGILLGVGNMGPCSVLPLRVSAQPGGKRRQSLGQVEPGLIESLGERRPSLGHVGMAL